MKYTYIIMFLLLMGIVNALEISSPQSTIYATNSVLLNITSNETLDSIIYAVDGISYIACENCTSNSTLLNLAQGAHYVNVTGILGNLTFTDEVSFNVTLPLPPQSNVTNFTLSITSPLPTTYTDSIVALNVNSNETLDSMSVSGVVINPVCSNCSNINITLNLSNGNYTVSAIGTLGNVSIAKMVSFIVAKNITVNLTNQTVTNQTNKTNQSKFTTGFEKLPKMVENSNISDAELAAIIRANKLNPGVLNRLIKTGKLGNESLNAIMDTQWQPPGIFKKLWSFAGFKVNTVSSLIAENYVLDNKTAEKILAKESLSKVKKQITANIKETKEKKVAPGQAKKIAANVASENRSDTSTAKTPPGQAKKDDIAAQNNEKGNNGGGKSTAPGQAKKDN